jgi:hypothetical protein
VAHDQCRWNTVCDCHSLVLKMTTPFRMGC